MCLMCWKLHSGSKLQDPGAHHDTFPYEPLAPRTCVRAGASSREDMPALFVCRVWRLRHDYDVLDSSEARVEVSAR